MGLEAIAIGAKAKCSHFYLLARREKPTKGPGTANRKIQDRGKANRKNALEMGRGGAAARGPVKRSSMTQVIGEGAVRDFGEGVSKCCTWKKVQRAERNSKQPILP